MPRWMKAMIVGVCFLAAAIPMGSNLLAKFGALAWAAGYCDMCPDADVARLNHYRDESNRALMIDAALLIAGMTAGIWWIVRPVRQNGGAPVSPQAERGPEP